MIKKSKKSPKKSNFAILRATFIFKDFKNFSSNYKDIKANPPLTKTICQKFSGFFFQNSYFCLLENVDAIGVDVMSLEDKRFSSEEKIHDFFRLMTRQFTAEEWMQIKDPQQHDLNAQLATFFRFWTLKESYVKGHGHGLGWNLQRLSFKVNPAEASLVVGQISDNSQLYLDGELAEQWYFAETLLDPQHCVATATKGLEGSSSYQNKSHFSLVTPQTIIDSLEPLDDGQISDATISEFKSDYLNKIEVKPF